MFVGLRVHESNKALRLVALQIKRFYVK